MSATPSTLRQRAAALRALATTIEGTPAMSLEHLAGDETWRGPRPQLCQSVLIANLAQLHAAVDDLRSQAWHLEREANELERAEAATIQPVETRAG